MVTDFMDLLLPDLRSTGVVDDVIVNIRNFADGEFHAVMLADFAERAAHHLDERFLLLLKILLIDMGFDRRFGHQTFDQAADVLSLIHIYTWNKGIDRTRGFRQSAFALGQHLHASPGF